MATAARLTFAVPIQGAPMTGARIKESGRAHMSDREMVLLIQFFGAPGTPGVPAVPAVPAVPFQPAIPPVPAVPPDDPLPGRPEIPGVPEVPASPEVPGVPAVLEIPEVAHPTIFRLEVTDTMSDAVRANPRAVDGVETYRKETPMACSALWQALRQGAPTEEDPVERGEEKMLGVLAYFGIIPAGIATTIEEG